MRELICPNCHNKNDPEEYIACDNDCDTYFCDLCDEPYYYVSDMTCVHGHNPKCGYYEPESLSNDDIFIDHE